MLEEQKEFISDELLVRLVRSRLVAEKVDDLPWCGAAEGDYLTRPSAMFYLKSLQAQLRVLKSSALNQATDQSK